MATSEVFTGARALLLFGTTVVGYAVACTGTAGITYQPLNVLGNLAVEEHVPTAYTVEFSAQLARLAKFSRLKAQSSFPGRYSANGKSSPAIMPSYGSDGTNILKSGELVANIQDIITQKNVYSVESVKCSQKSWEATAGGFMTENATFVARIMNEYDDAGSAILDEPVGE